MKEQIQCPVCKSEAIRIDIPQCSACQVECPRCTHYRVDNIYWSEFADNPEIGKIEGVLSESLRNYYNTHGKPKVLASGGDVMNVQRWGQPSD